MPKERFITKPAFALVEVILSATLLLFLAAFAVQAYLYGSESIALSGSRQRALDYAEEGLEAVRNIRDSSFDSLSVGTYGLSTSTGKWVLTGTSSTNGEFTRQISIASASTSRKIATSTVTWSQNARRSGSLSLSTYLNDWAKVTITTPDISLVGSASNPADKGTLAGPTVAVTPPSGMQNGDVALIIATYRASATLSVSNTGGQTWTALTQVANGTTNVSRIFYAVYNGSWSANPSITVGSGKLGLTVVMHVFRNVDPASVLDVAQTTGTFTAPAAPRDVTITGVNTNTDGAMVLAFWTTGDDNTWAVQTAGWANIGLSQYRNLTGNDTSISSAYKIVPTTGASGNVTNRQTVNGGDAGTRHILALKRKP